MTYTIYVRFAGGNDGYTFYDFMAYDAALRRLQNEGWRIAYTDEGYWHVTTEVYC